MWVTERSYAGPSVLGRRGRLYPGLTAWAGMGPRFQRFRAADDTVSIPFPLALCLSCIALEQAIHQKVTNSTQEAAKIAGDDLISPLRCEAFAPGDIPGLSATLRGICARQ